MAPVTGLAMSALGCAFLLGSPLPAKAQTVPSATEVLQAAARAMDTVQTLHISSVSDQTRNGLKSHWKTTGVCDASRVTDRSPYFIWYHQLRARLWIRGWSQSASGKRVAGSTHYLMLEGATNPRLWTRSSATGNHWQRTAKESLLSDVYDACAVLFPDSTGITPDPSLASYQLEGQKSVSGVPVWNVLETESGSDPEADTDIHWLVGTASSRILGARTAVKGSVNLCNASRCRTITFVGKQATSYSAFDQPVSIDPPNR